MQKPKAILLDLDDTLLSFDGCTDAAWRASIARFAARHPVRFSEETLHNAIKAAKRWYWGDPERHRQGRANLRAARREVTVKALADFGFGDQAAAHTLADDYCHTHWAMLHLLPGVPEVLQQMQGAGIRLALVTNGTSAEQRGKIERFGLERYFEAVFIEQELGFGKPDIRVFQTALDTLQLAGSDVWMVGDNLGWEIGPPQKLCIFTVWIDRLGVGLPRGSEIVPGAILPGVVGLPSLLGLYSWL